MHMDFELNLLSQQNMTTFLQCSLFTLAFTFALSTSSEYIETLSHYAKETGAKCLDGSTPVYYFREGIGLNHTKYLIWLEGGGWCHTHINGEVDVNLGFDSCYQRSQTRLGSKQRRGSESPKYLTNKGKGYLTNNKQLNPMMFDWNTAILEYCDGSSLSSDLAEPITITNQSGHSVKLYHRGYRILTSFIKHLYYNKGLNASTDIIISGESAGGLAVFLHINNINKLIQQFDKANHVEHKYKIVALIDSGIFRATDAYAKGMKWIYESLNVTGSIHPDCVRKEGYQCMFGLNLIKYIDIPMFIVGSLYDRWHIDNQIINTDIGKIIQHSIDLHDDILSRFDAITARKNALWLFRCYCHTGCFNQVSIHDRNILSVFSDWYHQHDDPYDYKYISEYEDYLCMDCEHLPRHIDELCIGFNQYPLERYANGSDKVPWNEKNFEKTMQLVKDLNPSCVRINLYIDWFFDVSYKRQAFEHSWTHYSTKQMQATFKVLDWYKHALPDTKIMTGLWDIKGIPFNSDESAELHARLVRYLIQNKGYNVQYYTPLNEPTQIPIATYCAFIEKLSHKLKEYEIPTEILTGPDAYDNYTSRVHWKCGELITVLDHHLFPENSNEIRSGNMKIHLSQQMLSGGLYGRLDRYKTVALTAMSMFKKEGMSQDDLTIANSFVFALDLIDYLIQSVFTGHTVIMFWCLDGFADNKDCGFWDLRNKKFEPRPWYFAFKLISNYFHFKPADGKLEIINIKQPRHGRILFIQRRKDWRMLVLNRNVNVLNLTIHLKDYMNHTQECKSLVQLEMSYKYKYTNYTKMHGVSCEHGWLYLEIDADSVVLISNSAVGEMDSLSTTHLTKAAYESQRDISTENQSKFIPSKHDTIKQFEDLNGWKQQKDILLDTMYYIALFAILCAVALFSGIIKFYNKEIKAYYHKQIRKCN
eukprot:246872_1